MRPGSGSGGLPGKAPTDPSVGPGAASPDLVSHRFFQKFGPLKAFCKRAWAISDLGMAQLADVNREIELSDRERRMQRSENDRLSAIIRAIDELMFSLEELNLQGIDRVPVRLRERAGALIELVLARPAPVEARSDPFRIRYRVVPMMDALFEVQDRVLRQRNPIRISDPEDQQESA